MFFKFLAFLKNFVLPIFLIVEICSSFPSMDDASNVDASSIDGKLVARLGCPYCHTSLKVKPDFKNKIPDLSYAGLRYNPAYLFEFLQNPQKIRRHIGISRMPNFFFSDQEALALVLFLETQKLFVGPSPRYPAGLVNQAENLPDLSSSAQPVIPAVEDSVCLTCHSLDGKEGIFAVDLATISYRLKKDWVKKYLVAPSLYDVPVITMPEIFYTLSADKKKFIKISPDAVLQINQVVNHLYSYNSDKKVQLDSVFQSAKTKFPDLTPDTGEQIFRSQNCNACHSHNFIKPPAANFTPDLSIEGFRVYENWLYGFLSKPYSLRPYGFHPGSGGRMPDFRLTEGMVQELTDFLMNLIPAKEIKLAAYFPQQLSAFSKKKAKDLLQDKLSCLGCHNLDGLGGKIGPDLSAVGKRLKPFYFYNQIINPLGNSGHTIMPKIKLPDKTTKLIADFLYGQNEQISGSPFLSLIDTGLIFPGQRAGKENNYLKFCASCHGVSGGGDGYNAKYLAVKPVVHSDSSYMSRRPDDTLFDGIYAGGYILNKSNFMPPFGFTIPRNEIEDLVAYMRQLCKCKGPDWSLDNK